MRPRNHSSENLLLSPEDEELENACTHNPVLQEMKEDKWFWRAKGMPFPEKAENNSAFLYGLFKDAERGEPTVYGLKFHQSVEYKQMLRHLKNTALTAEEQIKCKNKTLIDFLKRAYREHHNQQEPPEELIEQVVKFWLQSLMGKLRETAIMTLAHTEFSFPLDHTNTNPYTADLTMDEYGACLESVLDMEALRSTANLYFYALPGETKVTHRFILKENEGFKFEKVEFGSLILKKLCLEPDFLQQNSKALEKLSPIPEKALKKLRKRKEYTLAYQELSHEIENGNAPKELKETAKNVLFQVNQARADKNASLSLLTKTLQTAKSTLACPSLENIGRCSQLAQTLDTRTWGRAVACALADLALVARVVVISPLLALVSLAISTLQIKKVVQEKSAAPLLSKVSLFYRAVRKNPVSQSLSQLADNANQAKIVLGN